MVEIDTTGWRVIDNPPVRFRRAAGMQLCLIKMFLRDTPRHQ